MIMRFIDLNLLLFVNTSHPTVCLLAQFICADVCICINLSADRFWVTVSIV